MLVIQRVEISSCLQRPPLHFHKGISFLVWLVETFIWKATSSLVYLVCFWHSWLLDEMALWVKLPCSCNFFNTAPLVWCRHILMMICMFKNKLPNSQAVVLGWQIQALVFATVLQTYPAWLPGGLPSSAISSRVTTSSHVLMLASRSTSAAKFRHSSAP